MILLNKYSQRDKGLLQLERELWRLQQARNDAPIIPLEHPYQRGWLKSYTLREDARHHPHIRIFEGVLVAVNHHVHSRTRDFIDRAGNPIHLRPRILDVWEWTRLAWPVSHQRLFSYGRWRGEDPHSWFSSHRRSDARGFKLMSTWWLEEIIAPHMITHQRVELPAVRSRMAEIEAHLAHRAGWERLQRLHGRRVRWREKHPIFQRGMNAPVLADT